MPLSQVIVVIAAALLATSDALSDFNAASISNVASPSDPSKRLLRTHHAYDTTADEEERAGAPIKRVNSLARKCDIDLDRDGIFRSSGQGCPGKAPGCTQHIKQEVKEAKAPMISEDHF
ncbi:hypothetical protein JG687_00008658 [Phytophthora cactorum]|uniref:RxLR effector protein n=1 Tax=Phytophthora cactorum TaxID=29920 RepID=A0A329SH95_9STRA|nr:hypothetical protein Pcac1_g5953 [Phytophthora cactorum]KAG2835332.1 hypothetical protein PC112_g5709 [Phytophthora cactorum]KAG2839341.1 hypothetical protein PC111_g3909 [Phytophthora cactorum]KAG2863453.1 hypothetical protein PC113_g5445 [Phytophthora cactorum]KAG2899174.1 hypothetical protein PC115_g16622 [Phytophthora cactorum]